MRKTTKLKALALLTILTIGAIMPVTSSAQSTDGFFRGGSDNYDNRDGESFGLNNQYFGQDVPAPLGSGLLIMIAAGAGYAVARRRRNRNGMTMLLALALVLGMTQCKKNVEPIVTPSDGKIYITLKVANGSKHEVIPGGQYGIVNYTDGDQIYVLNDIMHTGAPLGILTYSEENKAFGGSISTPHTNDYLHFYYLGGFTMGQNSQGAVPCTMNTDQRTQLPVVSYGHTAEYYAGETSFTCWLLNQCGLIKFIPGENQTFPEGPIVISGLNTVVSVNFINNTITPTGTKGDITLYDDDNGNRWAVLLPQTDFTGLSVSAGEGYTTSISNLPAAITNNMYYTDGVVINITQDQPLPPVEGAFSVSENKQVYFSPGNLQYIGSADTPYWKFADNQWDCFGTTTGQNTASANVDRDLFGWGTSGWNNGNTYYNPWDTNHLNITDEEFNLGYGPFDGTNFNYDLTGTYANSDWGVYNNIYNPLTGETDLAGTWRTLTHDELVYLFDERDNAASLYGTATVCGIHGLVLLPDTWVAPAGVAFTSGVSLYSNNVYSSVDWNKMEATGAVFLPAAGVRGYKEENGGITLTSIGSYGYYWASTNDKEGFRNMTANNVCFGEYSFKNTANNKNAGSSVRLVREVESE